MIAEEKTGMNYWPSFVDIFASLFFIFLILFAVYYIIEGKGAEEAKKDVEDLKELLYPEGNLIDEKLIVWSYENKSLEIKADILFKFNKSHLSETGIKTAERLGEIFGEYLSKKDRKNRYAIIIEGHTDNVGDDISNNELSLARANSFLSRMKEKMVDEKYITDDESLNILIPVGYGESKLKVKMPGKKEHRCEENRRVEIKIIPKFSKTIENIWDEVFGKEP